MNYTTDDSSCRVEIFKPTGKWYTTIAVKFDNKAFDNEPRRELPRLIKEQFNSYIGCWAVCFDPYSSYTYPIMVQLTEEKTPDDGKDWDINH